MKFLRNERNQSLEARGYSTLIEDLGLLTAPPKVIAVVGAGGKTSLIHALAEEFSKQGKKVFVTTTTKIYKDTTSNYYTQLGEPCLEDSEKICSFSKSIYAKLTDSCDILLVEADGARRLPMKVPAIHEPVIPENADLVIGILGASAVGKPIEDVCFRSELALNVLGVKTGHIVTLNDLFFLLNSPDGQRKNVTTPYKMVIGQADLLMEKPFIDGYKYFSRE